MKKPNQRLVRNRKVKEVMARDSLPNNLKQVAEQARYVPSPYHKVPNSPMGPAAQRRWPHASKCDASWTLVLANRALKDAIIAGQVSTEWRGAFPRYVWHMQDGIVYEGFLSNEVEGAYHAYPLEDSREWPKGIS